METLDPTTKKPAKIIAVSNRKGGVGKSTTAITLTEGLVMAGKNVLFVDFDPQRTATIYWLGTTFQMKVDEAGNRQLGEFNKPLVDTDVLTVLHCIESYRFMDPKIATQVLADRLHFLPSDLNLKSIEQTLYSRGKEGRLALRHVLAKISEHYDYIIIDTGASDNIFLQNALRAATDVLVPTGASDFDLQELRAFIEMITEATEENEDLKLSGILLTKVLTNSKNQKDKIATQVKTSGISSVLMKSEIRQGAAIANMSNRKSVLTSDPNSSGAKDYSNLVKEVLQW